MDELFFDMNLYDQKIPFKVFKHRHSYMEIMVCLEGECDHFINEEHHLLKGGDILVMQPEWSHQIEIKKSFKHITIACTIDAPERLAPELQNNDNFHKLFKADTYHSACLSMSPAEYHEVTELTYSMLKEFNAKQLGWQTIIRSKLGLLITLLSRFKSMQGGNAAVLAKLTSTVSYMDSNIKKELRLGKLAKMTGLSECQFVRVFRKTYGLSPINYLINIKIANARRLLLMRGNEMSIAEVAIESGFSDSNYFCRQFRKNTGFTPLQYKKHIGNQ